MNQNQSDIDKLIEKEFEDLFDLFSRPGWGVLVDILDANLDNIKENIWNPINTEKESGVLIGQKMVLELIKNLKETKEVEWDQYKDSSQDEDDFDAIV